MRENDLRVKKTRAVIKNSLVGLMSESELSGITVSELCRAAQINRKTFYRHYPSVSDVAAELEQEALDEFSRGFTEGSIFDASAMILNISRVLDKRRGFYANMLKKNPDFFSKGKLKAVMCRMISASLKNSAEQLGKPVPDAQTLRAAAEYTASGVFSLYFAWFEGGCKDDLSALSQLMIKLMKGAADEII